MGFALAGHTVLSVRCPADAVDLRIWRHSTVEPPCSLTMNFALPQCARLVCQLQPQKFLRVCCIQVRRGHFGTIEVVKKRLVPPMIGVIWPLKKDSMEPSD